MSEDLAVRARQQPLEVVVDGRRPQRVADEMRPLLDGFFGGEVPVRFEFWDGSHVGPAEGDNALVVRSPDALRLEVIVPAPERAGEQAPAQRCNTPGRPTANAPAPPRSMSDPRR